MLDMKNSKGQTLDLPCYIDDIVYVLENSRPLPAKRAVSEIRIDGQGIVFTVRNCRTGERSTHFLWEFGSYIFTDYTQAKEALRKKREERA